jgi:hypothetical protein
MDQNELPLEPRYLGVPSRASKMIYESKVCLAQIVHLSCIQTDQNEISHGPRYVGVASGVSKMIYEPMIWRKHAPILRQD